MIRRLAPNTFNQILQLRDTLALDSAQVSQGTPHRDSRTRRTGAAGWRTWASRT
jgi:hypothetical protein